MKLSPLAPFALMAVFALASCGDNEAGVRAGPSGMLADSTVLAAMRSVDTGGRIIYAAPPDLSLASAQQRRPDIFRAPAPAAKAAAPKDSTKAEDATRRARRP
jgi:hypothetical protein